MDRKPPVSPAEHDDAFTDLGYSAPGGPNASEIRTAAAAAAADKRRQADHGYYDHEFGLTGVHPQTPEAAAAIAGIRQTLEALSAERNRVAGLPVGHTAAIARARNERRAS